uniref:Uncharacterized protein n=1 Tax=Anolis carolinensis TaxID=28377 RepID=A0A803SMS2_ANOCA
MKSSISIWFAVSLLEGVNPNRPSLRPQGSEGQLWLGNPRFFLLSPSQTCFHVSPHAFTCKRAVFGMYANNGINTSMEKSLVTGSDNLITFCDTFNFHPSYRTGGPSFCE